MVLCLLVFGRMGAAQRRSTDVLDTFPAGQVNWTTGVIQSRGLGSPPRRNSTPSQPCAAGYAEAIRAARQRLLEAVAQLRFDATQTVGSVLQHTVERQQRLEALVAAAEVVQTRYQSRGTVESTVQLSLFGPVTALLLPVVSRPSTEVASVSDVVYTGVVIDARGLALRSALFPRIVDENAQPVYDLTLVDTDIAARRGYMAYASTFTDARAKARIGERPFVVRARRVSGAERVDLVLRQTDAAQIQDHGGTRHLLRHCRVMILL